MRYGLFMSAIVLTAAGFAADAYADVTVTAETTIANGAPSPRAIYLTADQVKVDTPKSAIIFNTGAGSVVVVMKEKKEYMDLDLKAIGDRIASAEAMMKEKLQSVPDAQRKMVEAMMAQHMPGAAPKIPTVYEKTGASKTIGAWPCQVFHQKKGSKLAADLCIAPADAVGLTADDLAAFHSLAAAVSKSLPDSIKNNAAVVDFDDQTKQIGFPGIPVETIVYANGAALSTTTVKSVDHSPIAADAFAIPAGYSKKKMPSFLGGL